MLVTVSNLHYLMYEMYLHYVSKIILPWPPPLIDFSLYVLPLLTSSFAAAIITTAARGRHLKTNINKGHNKLLSFSYFTIVQGLEQPVFMLSVLVCTVCV